ncbi:MAG: GNAT family N-acetyltransferase [Mobilicoccus sp.]|nr:GNAT family N-acetyltransferase [Mobilicoccus sp.]
MIDHQHDSGVRWDHLRTDDVDQWAELANLLARVDGTEEFYEAADLAEELDSTGFTPESDTWAVWHGEQLVAYAQVRVGDVLDDEGRVRVSHYGGVHPDWRGRGLGRELVARATERGVDVAGERHPEAPHFFRSGGELEGSDARRLLTRLG